MKTTFKKNINIIIYIYTSNVLAVIGVNSGPPNFARNEQKHCFKTCAASADNLGVTCFFT